MLKKTIAHIFIQIFALQQLAVAAPVISSHSQQASNKFLAPASLFAAVGIIDTRGVQASKVIGMVDEANIAAFDSITDVKKLSEEKMAAVAKGIQNKAPQIKSLLSELSLPQNILNQLLNYLDSSNATNKLEIWIAQNDISGAEARYKPVGTNLIIKADRTASQATIFHEIIEAILEQTEEVNRDERHALAFIMESALYPESMNKKLSNKNKYDNAHLANLVLDTNIELEAIDNLITVSEEQKNRRKTNAELMADAAYNQLEENEALGALSEAISKKIELLSDGLISEKIKGGTFIAANVDYSKLSKEEFKQLNKLLNDIEGYGFLADKSDTREYKLKINDNEAESYNSVFLSGTDLLKFRMKESGSYWNIHQADLNDFLKDKSVKMVNNNPNLWLDSKGVLHLILTEQKTTLIDQTALNDVRKAYLEAKKASEEALKMAELAIKAANSASVTDSKELIDAAREAALKAKAAAKKSLESGIAANEAAKKVTAEYAEESKTLVEDAIIVARKARDMSDQAAEAANFQLILTNLKKVNFEAGVSRTGILDGEEVVVSHMPMEMSAILNGKKITNNTELSEVIKAFWNNQSTLEELNRKGIRSQEEIQLFTYNSLMEAAKMQTKILNLGGASKVIGNNIVNSDINKTYYKMILIEDYFLPAAKKTLNGEKLSDAEIKFLTNFFDRFDESGNMLEDKYNAKALTEFAEDLKDSPAILSATFNEYQKAHGKKINNILAQIAKDRSFDQIELNTLESLVDKAFDTIDKARKEEVVVEEEQAPQAELDGLQKLGNMPGFHVFTNEDFDSKTEFQQALKFLYNKANKSFGANHQGFAIQIDKSNSSFASNGAINQKYVLDCTGVRVHPQTGVLVFKIISKAFPYSTSHERHINSSSVYAGEYFGNALPQSSNSILKVLEGTERKAGKLVDTAVHIFNTRGRFQIQKLAFNPANTGAAA